MNIQKHPNISSDLQTKNERQDIHMARKFAAPMSNPYTAQPQQEIIPQGSTAPEAPKEEKKEYRFNLKLPIECKDYLQEMAWRNRTTITEYLTRIILADKDAHPEWKDTIDILNK